MGAASAWTACASMRFYQWYGCFMMCAELSTPFVNMRWWLYQCDATSSKAYMYNAILMLWSFFTVRILPLPLLVYNGLVRDSTATRDVGGQGLWLLLSAVHLINAAMQSYWFS